MTTYISILRGINVSGHRIIKMDRLKKMYETLNFKNVKTYLQSGNVIFTASESNLNKLTNVLTAQIEKEFGFTVPVIVLTVKTLQVIIANMPFSVSKNPAHIHISFLAEKPAQINPQVFIEKKLTDEEMVFTNNAIYLYCPSGYGQTKLSNNFIENKLKVTATTRNWKTTQALLNLAHH